MRIGHGARSGIQGLAIAVVALIAAPLRADEKLILLDDGPRPAGRFKVAADGSRLYFAGTKYLVFDAHGRLVDQIGTPQGSSPRDLIPLPNGWFIACDGYAGGHLALCRPDGTEAKVLVGKGGDEKTLRADMTGWTSPFGAAVDARHRRIFALDTTVAPANTPDPDWSRIAIFDFDGTYLGDLNRYDARARHPDDARRTWYDDIAVDPSRQRVFVITRRSRELLEFGYDGKLIGRAPVPGGSDGSGGLAVFPDGRVAVSAGVAIQIYGRDLKPVRSLKVVPDIAPEGGAVLDLETDAAGRLYASMRDPSITFICWSADLGTRQVFGPRYQRIQVDFPSTPITAGKPFDLKVSVRGRPRPTGSERWQVMARPSDGTDLRWQPLAAGPHPGVVRATMPASFRGLYDLAVRCGAGPIVWADHANDPYLEKTVAVLPPGAARSVAIITSSGRRAFRAGESIALQVVRRDPNRGSAAVRINLKTDGVIASANLRVDRNVAVAVPPSVTRRLMPGRYQLEPLAPGHESYALAIDIAPAEPDSPVQRILYHEFDNAPATAPQPDLADAAERMSFIRDYTRAAARLGFTRETDRRVGQLDRKDGPIGWRRDLAAAPTPAPGLAPADYYAIPAGGSNWEAEYYLDQAVGSGLDYDSQLLPHCSGVRFRESWLRELAPILQRSAQWFGRYPSFYGFNYNDEMFFGGFAAEWTPEDVQWLKRLETEKFKGRPHADVLDQALRVMYDRFNSAVRQADPSARLTTTPMWQFPAVEGSYAPVIYRGMSETYSHFISEGYHLPWYPAHSAEFLRRPGLPLMGVFDNGYKGDDGELYLKDAMQVLARGVQGTGVEHSRPFDDARAADAYRTANLLAKMYGPVFAQAPPANEAAVLYSRTQDVTERRNMMGTPHWERVYALYGAGLMAGVPMSIVYEEDLAAGWLLRGSKPRVPMLFLAGQTRPLPPAVQEQVRAFDAAGGKVFTDAESAPNPVATRLAFKTHAIKSALHEGYAGDTWFPLVQPHLETLASDLRAAVGRYRGFPIDTDDPWVSKNQFDGGAIRYLMVASETSPYPWDAGTVWALGTMYNKTSLPKTVGLTFPAGPGVVYDVFEHAVVKPAVSGVTARLAVDLTTFPGRLYALAPAPLGAPLIATAVRDQVLCYRVDVVSATGRKMAARVPVRIRLRHGRRVASELFRGTGPDGTLAAAMAVPAATGPWTLEVTELLGGKGSVATVPGSPELGQLLVDRPDVEPQRPQRIRSLLSSAGGSITLVLAHPKVLTAAQTNGLAAALRKQGITLRIAATLPRAVTPGVYLTAGSMSDPASRGALLSQAAARGLLPFPVSETVPGPGRGFFTAVFAPRGDREHCIALVGGDPAGLDRTVTGFIQWLATPAVPARPAVVARRGFAPTGKPAAVAAVPRLSDLVGARLDRVAVAADGRHLVLTAHGYLRNLALIEDQDTQARVVRAVRIGQAPSVGSAYVSADGRLFGASGRDVGRFGQGFHLVETATGAEQVFAAFGDIGRQVNRFAASSTGDVVLAPGTYGVVCWRRTGGAWHEAWAIDYWKQFNHLDWPVSAMAERVPQFHAVIPPGADFALILFGELSNIGWVTPENASEVWLAAVNLADGTERWRFKAPVLKTQLFPELHTSPDGSRLLLQVQMGSWGGETFRFFSVASGTALGSWNSRTAPLSVTVANGTGEVAEAFKDRLLEVRRPDGAVVSNMLWTSQPVSLAFAADGRGLYVADDSGRLTRLDPAGTELWHVELGCLAGLAAHGDRVYAAGWDGRLSCFSAAGRAQWTLDCTPAMDLNDPMRMVAESARRTGDAVHAARRPPTTSDQVPGGVNLLRTGKATLTVGGTPGWMSQGTVLVKPDSLTNGKTGDVTTPWLHLNELFWDSQAGRQVWAEIAFKSPTDVHSLTVHENPRFPQSWPTEGLVQVWDEGLKKWKTASFGLFLTAATNTYSLDLKQVTRLRYVPWNSYYRNFYTSEIEVR